MNAGACELSARARVSDLLELSKPRITLMVVLTTAVGFTLAPSSGFAGLLFLHALTGTAFLAAGASALNQVLERERDGKMRRTAHRPIPSGRLDADHAVVFGVGLVVIGLGVLSLGVNLLTALLGGSTVVGYLFVYTPMKPRTWLATTVGAVPGAVPPMMGWTAVRNEIELGAWILFAILFLWQLPHFLAIGWIYRDDYARGGFATLAVIDPQGTRTARQANLFCALLLPVSLLPSVVGLTGRAYFVGALLLGTAFLGFCLAFAQSRSVRSARRLMLYSVLYLPAVLAAMVLAQLPVFP